MPPNEGADVFVSYKREDVRIATAVVRALRAAGLKVWWDQGVGGGQNWREQIAEALEGARTVVVIWTDVSSGPAGAFVRDEARRGLERGVLVPVRAGSQAVPLGFGEVQTLDISEWKRLGGGRQLQGVVEAVLQRMSEGENGSAHSLQRYVATRRQRRSLIVALAAVLVSLGLGAMWWTTRSTALDAAWSSRTPGDCSELQRFAVDGNPYRDEAISMLTRAREERADTFTPTAREWRSFVRTSEQPSATEVLARQEAMSRASEDARSLGCAPRDAFEKQSSVEVSAIAEDCRADPRGGWTCSVDYVATCHMEVRVLRRICD